MAYATDILEKFETRRANEIVAQRLLHRESKNRGEDIVFYQMLDQIAVVKTYTNAEKTQRC